MLPVLSNLKILNIVLFLINNGIISEDEFEAINTAIQNLPTGSEVTLTGLVTLYGYGTAKPQLLITSASDIVGKELTDEDKIKDIIFL